MCFLGDSVRVILVFSWPTVFYRIYCSLKMCCFLPLHSRNRGVIWSWLKLLTDNKNIFTSFPILDVAFQTLYLLCLLWKPSKLNDKSCSCTIEFKSKYIKEIFGAIWLKLCNWTSGETFYLFGTGCCCKTRTFYFHFICKTCF